MTPTAQQLTFGLSTLAIFAVLAAFLVAIDFVPEAPVESTRPSISVVETPATGNRVASTTTPAPATTAQTVPTPVAPEPQPVEAQSPVRIVIDEIGIDTPVLTPASTDVEVLDRALLNGAVHYPDSPLAGEGGNMLIFGHSSYLPVVHNKAYQAFNELQKLTPGSIISVYTEKGRFDYKVDRVRLARAEEVVISFDAPKPSLTLATCNTFGAKQERWIATATLVSSTSI